jgi:hypothetical protein
VRGHCEGVAVHSAAVTSYAGRTLHASARWSRGTVALALRGAAGQALGPRASRGGRHWALNARGRGRGSGYPNRRWQPRMLDHPPSLVATASTVRRT